MFNMDLNQGCSNISVFQGPHQNSVRLKCDIKRIQYWGTTNITHHSTQLGRHGVRDLDTPDGHDQFCSLRSNTNPIENMLGLISFSVKIFNKFLVQYSRGFTTDVPTHLFSSQPRQINVRLRNEVSVLSVYLGLE